MAIINSYPTVTPTSSDLVLVVDTSEDGNPTKTATVGSLGLLSQTGAILNTTDVGFTPPKVSYVVSVSQAEYDGLVSAGTINANTLYVII